MPTPFADSLVRAAQMEAARQDDDDDEAPRMRTATKHSAFAPALAALLGGVADVATTQRNLAHGGHEQSPLMPQNRVANGLLLGGEYVGAALLAKLLTDRGHDKVAKAIGFGNGINGSAMALHNLGLFKWPGE